MMVFPALDHDMIELCNPVDFLGVAIFAFLDPSGGDEFKITVDHLDALRLRSR